jgi:hypothetical protein
MIEQQESYTNNQKQMLNKTTPKKMKNMIKQVCSNCCARRVGETTLSSSDKSVCA